MAQDSGRRPQPLKQIYTSIVALYCLWIFSSDWFEKTTPLVISTNDFCHKLESIGFEAIRDFDDLLEVLNLLETSETKREKLFLCHSEVFHEITGNVKDYRKLFVMEKIFLLKRFRKRL